MNVTVTALVGGYLLIGLGVIGMDWRQILENMEQDMGRRRARWSAWLGLPVTLVIWLPGLAALAVWRFVVVMRDALKEKEGGGKNDG